MQQFESALSATPPRCERRQQCTVTAAADEETAELRHTASNNPTLILRRNGSERVLLERQGDSVLLERGDRVCLLSTRPDAALRLDFVPDINGGVADRQDGAPPTPAASAVPERDISIALTAQLQHHAAEAGAQLLPVLPQPGDGDMLPAPPVLLLLVGLPGAGAGATSSCA